MQHRAGLPSSTTREATGLQHYAQGSILRARLQRLNQDRGVQKSARLGPTEEVLNTAAGLLNGMQVNTAMHLLCSHAEVCPYSPWIEQALAEAAETEEHWLGAREHWKNILRNQPPASIAVHAQGRLNDLEASEPLKQQMVVMQFDHLLFEECFLVHTGPETLPFATRWSCQSVLAARSRSRRTTQPGDQSPDLGRLPQRQLPPEGCPLLVGAEAVPRALLARGDRQRWRRAG